MNKKILRIVLVVLLIFQGMPLNFTWRGRSINLGIKAAEAAWQNAWQDAGGNLFSYRKEVSISGHTSNLTNYQVQVSVSYELGMQGDFDDLRFVEYDGTNYSELYYWRETYTASTSATCWVKVPSLTANTTKTIYMYYGNSTVSSASNGANTFGASAGGSAIAGCTAGEPCIVSSGQTVSTSGTYTHPYVRINSGVTLTISGGGTIVYFTVPRFEVKGTLTSTGGGLGATAFGEGGDGGTYFGSGSGGNGGNGAENGGSGGGGMLGGTSTGSSGGDYGGGGGKGGGGAGNGGNGGFVSIDSTGGTGIFRIFSGGSITATGSNAGGSSGCADGSGGGGTLIQIKSTLFEDTGSITATSGYGGSRGSDSGCGGSGGGGGALVYINYTNGYGTGSISLTAGNAGPTGGPSGVGNGGDAAIILPSQTLTGTHSGTTGGTTSKTFTVGAFTEPTASVGSEEAGERPQVIFIF